MSILTIVGPTGVGKTDLAVHLAAHHGAELISADSRQVYVGMDIATGKEVDRGDWQTVNGRPVLVIDGVWLHGLNMVMPNQDFSAADWCRLARRLISDIESRGHRPIIVGGTGFYLEALQGIVTTLAVPPDKNLRQELAGLTVDALFDRLMTVDASRAQSLNNSDRHNPMRLMRAIEIAINDQVSPPVEPLPHYLLHLIGLTMPRPQLLAKVDRRIDAMVSQGLVEETRQLLYRYDRRLPAMSGIGYAEIAQYLDQQIPLPQAMAAIKIRTHQYIKRQYTWFNRQAVEWIDITQSGWQNKAEMLCVGRATD